MKNVLIIDDDPRNIFALKATLKARGFNCLTSEDVQGGLQLLETRTPVDIILLDMMMPETDGYEAIPLIRKTQQGAAIPIIAVTAQAMPGDRQKCLDAGADEYIVKPVNVDRLLELLGQ